MSSELERRLKIDEQMQKYRIQDAEDSARHAQVTMLFMLALLALSAWGIYREETGQNRPVGTEQTHEAYHEHAP